MLNILTKLFVSSFLLLATNAFAGADLLNPDGMTPVMEGVDDGTVHINLGHAFPYYGGVFTDAWMSSNGFLMFYDPTKGFGNSSTWNNGCCNGFNPAGYDFYGNSFSYMLAPLWTDLRDPDGVGDAGYYYKTNDAGSAFLWYNVTEFGTNNTNTFQIDMYADGSFDFIYDEVDITNHSVWIGFTGDTSNEAEVNELMFAQSGMTEFDIEFHSSSFPGGRAWYGQDGGYKPVGPDCSNPLNDTSCPGYEEAYYTQQCDANPFYDTGCPGYEQAYYEQQCSNDPLYDQGCAGYEEAYYAQQCDADSLYDVGCPGYEDALFAQQCTYDPQSSMMCPGYIEPVEEPVYVFEDLSTQSTQNDTFVNYEEPVYEEPTVFEEPISEEVVIFQLDDDPVYNQTEDMAVTEELVANDGSVNEEQVLEESITEVAEEIDEEIAVLEDMELVEVLEEDILEEEIETEVATVSSKPKIDVISLVLEQTSEIISNLESKSINNDSQNSQIASNDSSMSQNEQENTSQAQESVSNEQIMAQESAAQLEMSDSTTDFAGTDSGLYGTDDTLYSMMTGSGSNDTENVSKNEQNEQNVQDTQQNVALGESAPIGFAIVPVQTANGIVETIVPVEEQSLAERLAEQVRQRNLENSNEAAVGQTAQLQRIASGTDMSNYYAQSYSSSNDLYTQEQVYGGVTINDNNRTHYNMFSKSYGTMRTLIRSQYK